MRLFVSFQFAPQERIPVGTLSDYGRETLFEYEASFLSRGLNPAPFKLPFRPGVQVFDRAGGLETFGVFEDSLPDGWGRRLVDIAFRKRHGRLPTVLERLACVGTTGMGALVYEPADEQTEEAVSCELADLAESAMSFDAGQAEDVLPEVRRAGGSSGGARPKAFIGYNPQTGEVCPERAALPEGFEHWLVKFTTRRDGADAGREEFRYYEKAVAAGVTMMPCRLIETQAGTFFATKRFDRTDDGGRLHFASAAGLLHADYRTPGEEYSLLFRLTDALLHDHSAKQELFRRVTLNVLEYNRDDHLKNFGFLMDAQGRWSLAPFYDFTRSEGPNGWQTLSVSGVGENPTQADLDRLAREVGLTPIRKANAQGRVSFRCSMDACSSRASFSR